MFFSLVLEIVNFFWVFDVMIFFMSFFKGLFILFLIVVVVVVIRKSKGFDLFILIVLIKK